MAVYFIEYDLRKARNYQKLYDELNSFQAKHVLESLWCIQVDKNYTAEEIRNHFCQFIDNDDGLIVTKASDWATQNVNETPYNGV